MPAALLFIALGAVLPGYAGWAGGPYRSWWRVVLYRIASPRPPRYVQAEAKVSGGEHADDFHYKGLVIEAQSYKSDGDSVADPKPS